MQQGPQRAQNNIMKSVMQDDLEQKQLCPYNPGGKNRKSPQGQGHTESLQNYQELFSVL